MPRLQYGLVAAVLVGLVAVLAGSKLATGPAHGGPPPRPPVPADTKAILKEISADRIQASIHTLVGFGTRHTSSSQTDYEIVYRDTTDPQWSHVVRVGNVTSYTLEGITKDNYEFGVRAVDTQGNRSVATFPTPQ